MQSVTTDIVQNVEKIENTATAWQVAPIVGERYTFEDTRGNMYLCQVDAIQGAKVWAFAEAVDAFNGWAYQRVDKLTLKPSKREFSKAVDTEWIAWMRDDQLHPEQDEEFVRNEYSKVWIR
jgi:preprotein translocase subunit Sss1